MEANKQCGDNDSSGGYIVRLWYNPTNFTGVAYHWITNATVSKAMPTKGWWNTGVWNTSCLNAFCKLTIINYCKTNVYLHFQIFLHYVTLQALLLVFCLPFSTQSSGEAGTFCSECDNNNFCTLMCIIHLCELYSVIKFFTLYSVIKFRTNTLHKHADYPIKQTYSRIRK